MAFNFVLVGVILTIFFLFVLSITKKSRFISTLPPGNYGWPILGESLDFVVSPAKFIHDRMTKHSIDIFKTSFGGEKIVTFCGESGNKFVFSNNAKFSFWLPRSAIKALALRSTSSKSWELYHEQLHRFFRLEFMQHFVPFMDTKAREHLEKHWVPYKEVKVQPLAKDYTLALAFRLLINCKDDLARKITEPFYTLAERLVSVPVNLPGTPYNQGLKASKVVQSKIKDIIRIRKAELLLSSSKSNDHVNIIDNVGHDILTLALMASDEEGNTIEDEELTGLVISTLFGGFLTTSSTITFLLSYLAEYPEVYAKVFQEQWEITESKREGELLTWKDIQRMKYSWNVVCETMRLRPPGIGGLREALNDISYAGFTVPKGSKVHWNVYSTHMNPTYFPNAEKFDPSRFEEKMPPGVFVPFGGGSHMCCGREYARIQTLVFLHNVVTQFKFYKVNPQEKVIYRPHPISVDGLRIRLQPHQKNLICCN